MVLLQDDSPLASDDESQGDRSEVKEKEAAVNEEADKSAPDAENAAKIPVSNHVRTSRKAPDGSLEMSPDRPSSGGKDVRLWFSQ